VAAFARRRPGVLRHGMEHAGLHETRAFSDQAVSRFVNWHLSRRYPKYLLSRATWKDLPVYYSVAIREASPLRIWGN